jgi:hypothetical protein
MLYRSLDIGRFLIEFIVDFRIWNSSCKSYIFNDRVVVTAGGGGKRG